MKNKQVFKNAFMAVVQTLVLGAILFLLYRYLLRTIGVEKLGIWSLVLASTSVTRAANLGLSGSVVKFVAKYAAHDDLSAVSKVIQTTFISVGLIVGIILLILYPWGPKALSWVLDPSAMPDALAILPYAFLSVWLSVLYQVYMGALDGLQRIDTRSTILMAGAIIQAVLAVALVQVLGLVGLALSQVIQYALLLCLGFISLHRLVYLPLVPYQWDRALFQEMLGYGVNFQVNSILILLYDPVTKGLLARFGGLAMLGYYEMASRLVLQVRGLIVSANQVLVPTIADLKERALGGIGQVYANSVRVVCFATVPMFAALIVAAPAIAQAWIGDLEPSFVIAVYALSIGYGVNTLNGPAYFAYLGIGTLRWNTMSHLLMAVLNIVLGIFLGIVFGGTGVLAGWVTALILGSLLLIAVYTIEQQESWTPYFNGPNLLLVLGAVLSIAVTTVVYQNITALSWYGQFLLVGTCFMACMFAPIWLHPVRRQLQSAAANYSAPATT